MIHILLGVLLAALGMVCKIMWEMRNYVLDPTDYGWVRIPDHIPNDVLAWHKGLYVLFYDASVKLWTVYAAHNDELRINSTNLDEAFIQRAEALITLHDG
jgi:hypothetical protein